MIQWKAKKEWNAYNSKNCLAIPSTSFPSTKKRIFAMINAIKQKQTILQQERDEKIRLAMEKQEQIMRGRCDNLHTIMKPALDNCVKQVMDLENKNEVVCSYISHSTGNHGYTRAEMIAWMKKYNSSIGRTDGITIASPAPVLAYSKSKFRCVIDKCIMNDETLQIFLDIA